MSKTKIIKFLKKKNWTQNQGSDYYWYYGKSLIPDNLDAYFILRTDIPLNNILYYAVADSLKYNELKAKSLLASEKDSVMNYQNIRIEEYYIKNLVFKFIEEHVNNQKSIFSLWISSEKDTAFYKEINKHYNNIIRKGIKRDNNIPCDSIYKFNKSQVISNNIDYINLDYGPEFQGGEEERMEFILNNIKYPDEAKEKELQGIVFLTFIVEKDGCLTNVEVIRGIGGGCDEEAVRLLRNMPRFIPASQNGEDVRVQFNMPIRFTLAGEK